ncbi:MAG: lytic transglycosylase domain-containing protein [Alphaproteobacteria bacterium]
MTRTIGWAAALVALVVALGLPADAEAATEPTVLQRLIVEEALNSRVPPSLALAVARIESNFAPDAESSAGARGVMQIMPATARGEFGVEPDELWDARLNVQLGVAFLEQLYDRYGAWDLALSHYNGGSVLGTPPHAVPLPVTRDYVRAVLKWERRYRLQTALWGDPQAKPGWYPARTSVRALAVAVAPGSLPEPLFAAGEWSLGSSIHMRRLRVRHTLDDFTPVFRWTGG